MWQDELLWYEKAVLWILRQGDVPSHVAIMPDGNRRFSRRTGTELRQTYVAGTLLYCREPSQKSRPATRVLWTGGAASKRIPDQARHTGCRHYN
ncbi:hypothetical protein MTO96_047017 [Rhipicephalus appendiculatus]